MPVTISTCTADALLMHQHTIQPHVAPCGYACAGLQSLTVSNVILEGTDNFPNHAIDLAGLLRPPLVPASTAVNLTNVALLHSVTAAQAAVAIATLRGMVSDPIVQRGIANWELQLYTVSMGRPAYSFMGVNSMQWHGRIQHTVLWESAAHIVQCYWGWQRGSWHGISQHAEKAFCVCLTSAQHGEHGNESMQCHGSCQHGS